MVDEALMLFERFAHPATGYAAINQAVADDLREGLTIDYKVLRHENTLITNGKFPPALRRQLSIYVSGFANVSGGVLVWGVNCPNNKAMSAEPVPDASKLCEHMKGLSLEIVDPPCVIEHRAITAEDGSGFIVTYVPQAIRRPIMATFEKENRYYMRTSDSCIAMSHSFISALMMARTSPKLDLVFQEPDISFDSGGPGSSYREFKAEYRVVTHLKLYNHGPGIARDCAVILHHLSGKCVLRPSDCKQQVLESSDGTPHEGSYILSLHQPNILHPRTGIRIAQVDFLTNELFGSRTIGVEISAEGFSESKEIKVDFGTQLGREKAKDDAAESQHKRIRSSGRSGNRFM